MIKHKEISGIPLNIRAAPATKRLVTLNSRLLPLIVAPAERFLKTSQQANIILEQNTLLFVGLIVDSSTCKVLCKDALFEASLQVPVAPLLHLLVRQPHVHRWEELMSIAVATSQRRLVLPSVTILLLVTDVSTWNALVLTTD